jgi:hypothetical protein
MNLEKAVNHRDPEVGALSDGGTELKNKRKGLKESFTSMVKQNYLATYCFLSGSVPLW